MAPSRREFIKYVVAGSAAAVAEWAELVLAGKPGAKENAVKALRHVSE